jgi:hypothetical protein
MRLTLNYNNVVTKLGCKEFDEDLNEIKGYKLKNTRITQSDYTVKKGYRFSRPQPRCH